MGGDSEISGTKASTQIWEEEETETMVLLGLRHII